MKQKKYYHKPQVTSVKLDSEISLSMVSVPPNPMPQNPNNLPEGIVQRLFKLRW